MANSFLRGWLCLPLDLQVLVVINGDLTDYDLQAFIEDALWHPPSLLSRVGTDCFWRALCRHQHYNFRATDTAGK